MLLIPPYLDPRIAILLILAIILAIFFAIKFITLRSDANKEYIESKKDSNGQNTDKTDTNPVRK